MKKTILTIVTIIITASALYAQTDSRPYLRYPALSPDGNTVCFSCKGDLWLVPVEGGEARQLTTHPADDIMPQFSPDGRNILFSSDRNNNFDLYVIPAEGGKPVQLTFYTGGDYGTGWTPDGDTVIFYSYRQLNFDIFKISVNGGTPIALTGGYWEREYFGKISPDGNKMIYNNGSGRTRWWKSGLTGNTNSDIWILDRGQPDFDPLRITSDDRHDLWPIYDQKNEAVYFIACRDGEKENIWKKDLASGMETRITSFTDDGVQWLNSNPQMDKLVFEQDFLIWYLDPKNGTPEQVAVKLAADYRVNPVRQYTYNGNIQEYDISPDGRLIAMIIRGEVFLIPVEKPEFARRISNTSQREKHPAFSPDSKTLFYASDRSGNYDIFAYDLAAKKEIRITDTPENEAKPLSSPDGKKLVYYRGLDRVILYDLEKAGEIDSITGIFIDLAVEPNIEYDFSPDSRYLALTMAGETYETNIYISDFNFDPVNVSQSANECTRPRFSKDGKWLTFSRWTRDDKTTTYKIELAHKPAEFAEARLDSLLLDLASEKKDKDKDKDKPGDKEKNGKTEPTQIDFKDIHKRVSPALSTEASSYNPVITPDGKMMIFIASIMGKPELWSIKLDQDDPDLTQLTHSGKDKDFLKISDDSKYAFYLEGGKLRKLDIKDKKIENIDFTAELDVVTALENHQKMNETFWMFDQYFYDPDHHGIDWAGVYPKYSRIIDEIESEDEFLQLIREMMGELKTSHIDIYSSSPGVKKELATAWYGFTLDNSELDKNGFYRIELVLPNSPAALAETPLKRGDYITAVNGERLSRQTNFYTLFNGQVDKKTVFTVADSPGGKTHDTALKGVTVRDIINLSYDFWVETRRTMVDSLSGGRLAYLHIRSMNRPSLEQFKLELVNQTAGKEGLVLDVRHNGGGNTAVELLGILVKEPYIMRNFAGYPVTSENKMRSKALEKPSILLIDNGSGSNSEIFAEGFRKLGLGKIVGTRTSGGVIGTASYNLIDGTRIRRPSWGCFTTEMENLEKVPRYPDITVENLPSDIARGRDTQLERAIKELLMKIDSVGQQ